MASSPPTAASQTRKRGHTGGRASQRELRGEAVAGDAWAWPWACPLSEGRYSWHKSHFFLSTSSICWFQKTLWKVQHLLSLEAAMCGLGLPSLLWEGLVYSWWLEMFICSFSLFLFKTCITQTQRGCGNLPKWWEERTCITTMKLLIDLDNSDTAETDLGKHSPMSCQLLQIQTLVLVTTWIPCSEMSILMVCHLAYSDISIHGLGSMLGWFLFNIYSIESGVIVSGERDCVWPGVADLPMCL